MAQILLNVKLNATDAKNGLNELVQEVRKLPTTTVADANTQIQNLRLGYNNLITTVKGLKDKYPTGTFDKILEDAKQGASAVKNLNVNSADYGKTAGELSLKLKTLRADLAEAKAETDKNTDAVISHNQNIISMLPNILKWQVAMTLVMQPIQKLRQAIDSINETLVKTEDTVISLQRVLDEDLANSQISDELYGIAEEYGQTFENVSQIAENFARTGMSWADTLAATKAAVLGLNVAELDAQEASEGLIAIYTQFGMKATDLEGIIDKLNKTADNFPVTTEKLIAALQRTGSAATNANVSFEQTVGLITALSEATGRSGENIGTALNALFQYSSKDTALETFSNVSDEVAAIVEEYKKGSKSIYDIWKQLSVEINDITDEQANVLEAYFNTEEGSQLAQELGSQLGESYEEMQGVFSTANTFRKNYFIALLKDFATVDEASEQALNALGYSQKENEQYLESYTAKVNTLQSKWQEVANDAQGLLLVKKTLADIGVVALDIIQWTGGFRTTLIAIATIIPAVFGNKIVASVKNLVTTLKAAKTAAGSFASTLNMSLGIIGAVATAISILVGVVEQYEQKQSEARQETIAKWNEEKETAEELTDLYAEYEEKINSNAEKDDEFYKIESKIVELLGDKAGVLEGLTTKTDEYTSAVKKLTEKEKERYEQERYEAKRAAEENLTSSSNIIVPGLKNDASANEIYIYYEGIANKRDEAFKRLIQAQREGDKEAEIEAETQYERYKNIYNSVKDDIESFTPFFEEQQNTLEKSADEMASRIADKFNIAVDDLANSINENGNKTVKTAEELKEELEAAKKEVEEAEKIQEKQNAVLEAQKDLAEAIKKAQQEYLTSIVDDYLDSLEQAETLEEKQNAVIEARKELEEAIAEAKQKALLDALKTERDGQKEALSLDEKRYDVEKARQDLIKAETQLTTKVYNANGGFSWQASGAEIKSAQGNYNKALEDYNSAIEDSAWDEVEQAIENGNTDTTALKKIINKWAGQWQGEGKPAFVETIESTIKEYQSYVPTAEEISSATEKVKTAVDNLNEYLKTQAVADIKTLISSGNVSASGINAILTKWLNMGEGSELKTWGNQLAEKINVNIGKYAPDNSAVANAISKLAKAQEELTSALSGDIWKEAELMIESKDLSTRSINELIKKYNKQGTSYATIESVANVLKKGVAKSSGTYVDAALNAIKPKYDEGGVLSGLGGIKATAEDEIVLPPEIAKKILEPTSNAQFHQFLQDMGILYGAAPNTAYARRGDMISTVNNDTRSDNRSYTVNGVPIPEEMAKTRTVAEIFEDVAFSV